MLLCHLRRPKVSCGGFLPADITRRQLSRLGEGQCLDTSSLVVMATSCLSDFFALGRIVRGLESIGLYSVAVGAVYLSAGGTVLSKGLPTALFLHEQHALCVWPEQQGWCCSGRLGVTEVGTSFVIVVRLGLETG